MCLKLSVSFVCQSDECQHGVLAVVEHTDDPDTAFDDPVVDAVLAHNPNLTVGEQVGTWRAEFRKRHEAVASAVEGRRIRIPLNPSPGLTGLLKNLPQVGTRLGTNAQPTT